MKRKNLTFLATLPCALQLGAELMRLCGILECDVLNVVRAINGDSICGPKVINVI